MVGTSVLLMTLFCFLFIIGHESPRASAAAETPLATVDVPVGVILGLQTQPGKESLTSIQMAIEDFYASRPNFTTRVVLHVLDSKQDVVEAASAAVDLMKNTKVAAIIGPVISGEAEFIAILGSETQTPVISYSASSPSLSIRATPFFVRATIKDSDQSPLLAAIVKYYGWHDIIPVYEDSAYGSGILPSLIDALQSVDARVPYRTAVAPFASDDRITAKLYHLKTLPSRIFIVHMTPPLASRFFRLAASAGMVAKGYSWIATDGITNFVDMDGALDLSVMQGVIGVKPHVPSSPELEQFTARWRAKYLLENPREYNAEPSVFQLWAYDATQAVALAVEKAFSVSNFRWQRTSSTNGSSSDMAELGIFEGGPTLLAAVQSTSLYGVSGDFRLSGGELNPPPFDISNFVGKGGRTVGYWTPATGISFKLGSSASDSSSANLKALIWPGESTTVPKGWEIPTGGRKLQIAVPVKNGFNEFVNVQPDPLTNSTTISGYCIDVFDAVMEAMPYSVSYEYIPFKGSAASYDNLVSQVYFKNYDAVVGDTTILANRTAFVDFTLQYTDSGVAMVVPMKPATNRNYWIFLKPLTTDLWLGTLVFFFFTGLVVWAIEHRINPEFRGRPSHQIGNTLFFVFSTLVFSHKEKLESNLSRLVVVIWVFVVLIITSSYTASLTSMLTVQQLQPAPFNIDQLVHSKARVGYQDGSFVFKKLQKLGFSNDRLQNYSTPEQYKDAMLNGSNRGGVDAIFDEIPYLKLFMSEYCSDFAMVGRINKTDGFGFVFPRGSPLVSDVSRAILKLTESDIMMEIERKWLGNQMPCLSQSEGDSSTSLNFRSFGGLFLITGTVSVFALLVYILVFLRKEWDDPRAATLDAGGRRGSFWDKVAALAKHYDSIKDESGSCTGRGHMEQELSCNGINSEGPQTPISISKMSALNCGSQETVASGRTSTGEMPTEQFIEVEVEPRRGS